MIIWLTGDPEHLQAVIRVATAALAQRGFPVRQVQPETDGEMADALIARARNVAGDSALVFVLAGAREVPGSAETDDVLACPIEATGEAGRAAEALLDDLEKRGVLAWGYSREEEEQIQKHLEDLGYL